MKIAAVTLILCACVWAAAGDVAHVKAAKAKVLGRLITGKHHKRGILTGIPPYKLGHDIPLVTHSVVKPLVVTYPPTATVSAVKVPLTNPLVSQYPVPVGHKVPVPHPHYGLKFPHTKVIVPKPDHHYHHHHHHVAPKPVVPIVPVPPPVPVPVPQPAATIAHPVPAPSPPVFVHSAPVIPAPPVHAHPLPLPHAPVLHSHPLPLAPPPVHALPPNHLHLRPLFPAAAFPLPQAQSLAPPVIPQIPYVLRPGGAAQTSYFATFPRHPLLNYQSPLPLAPSFNAGQFSSVQQVLLERPQYHYIPQAAAHGAVFEQHIPNVAVEQTPLLHPSIAPPSVIPLNPPHELPQPGVHLHPTQAAFPQQEIHVHSTQAAIPQHAVHLQPTQPSVHLDHDGWSPVPQQHDIAAAQSPEAQYPQQGHQFTQEQGTQVYEHHTEEQYHDFQQQLQHHIQQQIEQAQYEQHLNNQHQLGQDYDAPQVGQEYGAPNDYFQQNQNFPNPEYAQGQDFSQHGSNFGQSGQDFSQNDYNLAQPGQEYGTPQQAEGRSVDQGDQGEQGQQGQQFHNHIPLGLQPPIDRPLEHFR